MNNISVGSELAAFLKHWNHRVSAIRPLEAGDSYVQFIPLINRYRIFTDISGNYADSIGTAARIIVESLVEELTKEELFTKLATQMLRFQNVKAYQVKLEDIRYPGYYAQVHNIEESFESKDVIYHFIESIDEVSGNITFEDKGYKLKANSSCFFPDMKLTE